MIKKVPLEIENIIMPKISDMELYNEVQEDQQEKEYKVEILSYCSIEEDDSIEEIKEAPPQTLT